MAALISEMAFLVATEATIVSAVKLPSDFSQYLRREGNGRIGTATYLVNSIGMHVAKYDGVLLPTITLSSFKDLHRLMNLAPRGGPSWHKMLEKPVVHVILCRATDIVAAMF